MDSKITNQMIRVAELQKEYDITLHGNSDAIHLIERIEPVLRDQILDAISEELFEADLVEKTDAKYELLLTTLYYEIIYRLNTDNRR
jgi:hypothetical protein